MIGAACRWRLPDGVILSAMRYVLLYVTTGSREEALTIGRAIVQERLAACANLLPAMTSIYHWQGAIEQSDEAVLLLKTRADLADRATQRIVTLHSYECPCVVSFPIEGGNPPYLRWISDETSGSDASW
jgi:periplasmic divalent cation tolerance protein